MHSLAIATDYTERFRQGCKQSGRGIIEMAKVAGEVRDTYGYQTYVKWLEAEFGLSRQTGDRLLAIHKNLLATPKLGVGDLDRIAPSALYLLASDSTPEPVRQHFIKEAKNGKPVTHAEVKRAVTPEPSEPDDDMDNEPERDLTIPEGYEKAGNGKNKSKPTPRGTFDDAQVMLETFKQIGGLLKTIQGMKPKRAMATDVAEAARAVSTRVQRIIADIEKG